VHQQVYSC